MADANCTVGVDLGGTKMIVSIVDSDGRVLTEEETSTGSSTEPEAAIRTIVTTVERMRAASGVAPHSLGIGIAGQVDGRDVVRFAPNLRWRDVAIGPPLSKALGIPARVINDVRAATFGEWRFGKGRGESDLVCLRIGTGVGGGIVSGNRLLVGASNAAGELGHMTVVTGGRKCTCPNSGCLEAYVGGWAIAARAVEAAHTSPTAAAASLERARRAGTELDAEVVSEMAKEGDPFARGIMDETRTHLAAGLVAIANALNPRLIVAGGGVIRGTGSLFEEAFELARPRILPSISADLRGVRAELGTNAVAVGAAAWAHQEAGTWPAT
jgi:glucokinase